MIRWLRRLFPRHRWRYSRDKDGRVRTCTRCGLTQGHVWTADGAEWIEMKIGDGKC